MDSIIVNVNELFSKIRKIKKDGCEFVQVSVNEPDWVAPLREKMPACLSFLATADGIEWVNYEEVEEAEDAPGLDNDVTFVSTL